MFRRIVLLSLLVVAAGIVGLGWYGSRPAPAPNLPVELAVPPGSSLKAVALGLEAKGMIRHPVLFVAFVRLLGQAGNIKAGSYLFEKPLSPFGVLRKIASGETMLDKVTIVEGWRFSQMRAELDGRPDIRHDTAGWSDAAIMQAIGAPEADPEGMFFPDTYYFDAGGSDLDIYRRAYHLMQTRLNAAWRSRATDLPYQTPYQALTMASIIEKETAAADERPRVASVFVNRLHLGMPLQSDPTVIYGLGAKFDGDLHKSDLQTDTPYNTYTRRGLPPTPISLPSEQSILAALHPASTKASYFVAKGNGRHQFSDTLQEQNRAVYRYQIKGGA